MVKGWKKLSKSEKKHVTFDAGCRNTATWLRTVADNKAHEEKTGSPLCWDCKSVAKKLGDW